MKKLFIAIAALAAMTSCSQDEVMEVAEKQAISFGTSFVDKSTRAVDNTYGSVNNGVTKLIQKFKVYGTVTGNAGTVNIFNGNEVSNPGLTSYNPETAWTCNSTTQYWIPDATYKFAAVVDADGTTTTDEGAYGMPTKLTYKTDGQKDLLYAENNNPTYGQIVPFTFDHLLSKVWFTVNSTTPAGYHYNVKNIQISNFEEGTYTISDGNWEGTKTGNISFGNVDEVTLASGAKTNETQMLLIPNEEAYTITFTVELYVNNQKAESNNYSCTVSHELVKGHSYNFNIDLTVGQQILFTVQSVKTWVDGNDNPATTDKKETSIPVTLTPAA